MMREMVLTAASLALTGAVVANAYYQKHQFYPSVVYLTKSSPSMAVLYLQAFVFVILLGKLIRKVFFGQLRPAEMEHLIERSWYAVTETCLAFTVFRDDFSPRFVAQFTMLLFVKCFHWLAEDRIDYMERSPVLTWLFHARAVALLTFLGLIDSFLIHVAYNTTIQSGASVQLVFGFEYAILLTIVATILMKYTLHVIDLQSENPWDNKAVYLLYTELIMGFLKAILYICFVVIMVKVHTFPLFAIRPMYLTLRGFKKSLSDVIMSRRAIANMNTLYPDATPEELSQGDNVCIICREEMTTGCKKIPCNHIFHASCLRSWFQRQQTCPTCRMDVLRPMPRTSPPPPQQPVQPQQPNAPQMMPPFGMFPGWPPVPPQPFQQPGQQPMPGTDAAATATPATSSGTSGETAQQQTNNFANQVPPFAMPPPFMMPPPPFMMTSPMFGMPFMPPNPPNTPSTPDLAGASLEELKNIETQERQNLENRIATLRNIHMLLDTAVSQMNNYMVMFNAQSSPHDPPPVSQPSTSATRPTPSVPDWPSLSNISMQSPPVITTPSQPTNLTSPIITTPSQSTNLASPPVMTTYSQTTDTTPLTPTNTTTLHTNTTTSFTNAETVDQPISTNIPEPETIGTADEDNDNSNELRRRRLERFTKEEQDNKDDNIPGSQSP